MKIKEITESITDHSVIKKLFLESLDRPFPYTQVSPSTWEILVEEHGELLVTVQQQKVNTFNIAHVMFKVKSSNSSTIELTGWFQNSGATGVFASVIEILKNYGGLDLLIFVPDDITINVKEKKARLYRIIMNRMMRNGMLLRVEEMRLLTGEVIQLGFPGGSRLVSLPNGEIEALLVDYMIDKTV